MDLLHEVRLSVRNLLTAPGYTAAAVLTLALGIGANSAIFGAVRAVLLEPLPIRQANELVICWEAATGNGVAELSYRHFEEWAAHSRSFSQAAAIGAHTWTRVLDGRGNSERLHYSGVSASFFDTLGVRPFLGRLLTVDDDLPNAPAAIVLSHGTWTRRFGANPAVIGTAIRLDDQPHTIVGVAPPGFDYPRGAEFWAPVVPVLAASGDRWRSEAMNVGVLFVVGRLAKGVTPAMAREELDGIATRQSAATKVPRFGSAVVVTPFAEHLFGPVRPALWALLAAVVVLLLVACANVSGLMLTRVSLRQREQAVRLALGASRGSLGRLWIIEASLLSLAGGVLGLLASRWIAAAVVALAPDSVPRLTNLTIDLPVAFFTFAAVLVTAILCGVGPVRQAGTADLVQALNDATRGTTGRRSQRARSLLLVFQIGLAVVLLVAAGLTVRSFVTLRQLDLGFSPSGVLAINVSARDDDADNSWVDELLRRIAALPDVESAGAVYLRPLGLGPIGQGTWFIREGQPEASRTAMENPTLNYQSATPGYFTAMRIALKRGRLFNDQDTDRAARVALIGESTARRLWPDEDPIGRRILMPSFKPGDQNHVWRTVVGVVADVRYRGLDQVQLDIYDAALQSPMIADDLVIRTSSDPLALVGAVQTEARRLRPRAIVDGVTTMEGIVSREAAPWTFSVWMFTSFAVLAFLLAMVGLFSVVSLDVAHRSREFAVRLALGAQQRDIYQRVLMSAATRVGAGLTIGMAVALAATQGMRSLLFGVDPLDGATYGAVIGLIVTVVAFASSLPARSASGLDPMVVLKRE